MTIQRKARRAGTHHDPGRLNASENRERLGILPDEEIPFHCGTLQFCCPRGSTRTSDICASPAKRWVRCSPANGRCATRFPARSAFIKSQQHRLKRFGWDGVFATLGFLSLNLGIFNLLPIPVLDGGAIFLLMIEGALAKVGLIISRRSAIAFSKWVRDGHAVDGVRDHERRDQADSTVSRFRRPKSDTRSLARPTWPNKVIR